MLVLLIAVTVALLGRVSGQNAVNEINDYPHVITALAAEDVPIVVTTTAAPYDNQQGLRCDDALHQDGYPCPISRVSCNEFNNIPYNNSRPDVIVDRDLRVTPFLRDYRTHEGVFQEVGINVTFVQPYYFANPDLFKLDGFQIRMDWDDECYRLDLTNTDFRGSNNAHQFIYQFDCLYPLEPNASTLNSTVDIFVCTWPPYPDRTACVRGSAIVYNALQEGHERKTWKSINVSAERNITDCSIMVTFKLAPRSFGYDQYRVRLYQTPWTLMGTRFVNVTNVNHTLGYHTVKFNVSQGGSFRVMVHNLAENGDVIGFSGGTHPQDTIIAECTLPPVLGGITDGVRERRPGGDVWIYPCSGVGGCMLIVAVVVMAAILKRKRVKRILVVSVPDSTIQRQIVYEFNEWLQNQYDLVMMTSCCAADTGGGDRPDAVLIVNSHALARSMHNNLTQGQSDANLAVVNKMMRKYTRKSLIMKIRGPKVYQVSFPHSGVNAVEYGRKCKNFNLMDDKANLLKALGKPHGQNSTDGAIKPHNNNGPLSSGGAPPPADVSGWALPVDGQLTYIEPEWSAADAVDWSIHEVKLRRTLERAASHTDSFDSGVMDMSGHFCLEWDDGARSVDQSTTMDEIEAAIRARNHMSGFMQYVGMETDPQLV